MAGVPTRLAAATVGPRGIEATRAVVECQSEPVHAALWCLASCQQWRSV